MSKPTRSSRRSASCGKRSIDCAAPRAAERPPDEKVRVPLNAPRVLGRADAPVTLVEFTDLECPFCRSFHVGAFEKIKQTYIDTRQGPLRHLRLPARHPSQRPPGRGGRALRRRARQVLGDAPPGDGQRRDAAAARSTWSSPRAWAWTPPSSTSASTRDRYKADIDRDMAEGLKLGVNGTPDVLRGQDRARRHRGAADRRRPALPGVRSADQGPARRTLTAGASVKASG